MLVPPRPRRSPTGRRRAARVAGATLLVAAIIAGCGSDEAEPAADAAEPAAEAPAGAGDTGESGDTALGPLAFTAPLVGGGTFDGSAYGERPVVLWFWAPG